VPDAAAAARARAGYAYNAGERPSENVPWTVMAELGIGGNACAASASFTNVSCALPPDVVTISWLIQSIVEILDVEQARPAAAPAL
jgi:hypothetical protein